jgi:hypothetical protein
MESRRGEIDIRIHGQKVEIIPYETTTMYLGRALSFGRLHDAELENRINKGWAKLHAHKHEL